MSKAASNKPASTGSASSRAATAKPASAKAAAPKAPTAPGPAANIVISDSAQRRIGIVESDSREKSRKITIQYVSKHPKYGKYVRRRTVLHAHDAANESRKGDRVEVAECRPISRTKRWTIVKILEKAPVQLDAVFVTDDGKKKK